MNTEQRDQSTEVEVPKTTFADFLETVPPGQLRVITDLANGQSPAARHMGHVVRELAKPDLRIHCPHDSCNGTRYFRVLGGTQYVAADGRRNLFVSYVCANCQRFIKTFAFWAKLGKETEVQGTATKFGEQPPFGPPTPSRLISLIGPDREEFLKGRRCENQGLGVGAFIYYRRVVENQKNRILGEIVKVAERIGAGEHELAQLRAAISETQFSRALSIAKDVIPQSLLINGHSPLALLHDALSDGVHARSDEDCLEIASSVRVVLGELSERLSQALKDEAELTHALSTLMNRRKDG